MAKLPDRVVDRRGKMWVKAEAGFSALIPKRVGIFRRIGLIYMIERFQYGFDFLYWAKVFFD